MKKFLKHLASFIILIGFAFIYVSFAYAQQGPTQTGGTADQQVIILGQTVDTGSMNGFAQLAVAFAKWILSISGAASLLMFVYGGVRLLISGGAPENVRKGQEIIKGATYGLLIVFLSYTIIGFALSAMGYKGNWATISF